MLRVNAQVSHPSLRLLLNIVLHDRVAYLIEALFNINQLVLVVVADEAVELLHELLLGRKRMVM